MQLGAQVVIFGFVPSSDAMRQSDNFEIFTTRQDAHFESETEQASVIESSVCVCVLKCALCGRLRGKWGGGRGREGEGN